MDEKQGINRGMSMRIMTKKEWMEYLENTWDAAQKEAWAEHSEREWVGLTDDEVFELADTNLYDGGKNYGVLAFAKSIEAKLKERNE
jgi:hypothetical protein